MMNGQDEIPGAEAAEAPEAAWGLLRAAAGDAERWLARWLSQQAASEAPADVREINYAASALHRLIDARKKIMEEVTAAHAALRSTDEPADSAALDAQVRRVLAVLEPEGEDRGDADALPE